MKKIILILVGGVCYTSIITGYATAQSTANISYAVSKTDNVDSAKIAKALAATTIGPGGKTAIKEMKTNLRAAKANLKVNSHFNKNFKDVSDVSWNEEEKSISVNFKMNEKSGRVVYDKRGNWLFTVINYQEDQLPGNTRRQVNAAYKEFTISLVQEISEGDVSFYLIHLENSTRLKQVLMYNDEITDYADYKKSR